MSFSAGTTVTAIWSGSMPQERYFLDPYRFIPPFRGKFWCRIAKRLIPRHLRRHMGVLRWHFEGIDLFHQSLAQGAGMLLTPNHSRWPDPLVMGTFGIHAHKYLYYIASYHLFRQSRVMGWVLNRIGGYSIWREGSDRESIKTTARILAEADRPVVLFPEGTWFRQNDRVGLLQDGLSLITRQAARQSDRPILVHPIGLKYWVLQDPLPALMGRMTHMERRLGWRPQDDMSLVPRIEKLTGAILALKEIEYLGSPREGGIDERIAFLVSSQIGRLEQEHLGKTFDGWPLERIRRLRQLLARRLLDVRTDAQASAAIKKDLDNLLFCENIKAHSHDYLLEWQSLERLTETVERLDEIMLDELDVRVVPMGVTVSVGPAIDVRSFSEQRKADRNGGDPLVVKLRAAIQERVDYLRMKGPPAEWDCPRQQAWMGTSTSSPPAPVLCLPDTETVTLASSLAPVPDGNP
jgi:1-acyl-sn-glycerol-3-phosphate acyltransferase